MAGVKAATAFIIQPAFTGGEISEDIAARVDLDKYQRSLTAAQNTLIKPYGAVYKRPGTIFCGSAKHSDRTAILARFNFDRFVNYLLEIGDRYIRIWRDGAYLGIELAAPFTLADLPNLRMTQSADVMYICSRRHPVQVLSRYAENNWTLTEFDTTVPPFEPINPDEENLLTPSGIDGNITVSASKDTFDARQAGAYIKIMHEMPSRTASVTQASAPTSGSIISDGVWALTISGNWAGQLSVQRETGNTWSTLDTYYQSGTYGGSFSGGIFRNNIRMTATLTAGSLSAFLQSSYSDNEGMVSNTSTSFSAHSNNSQSLLCGGMWKLITHGTWTGTVVLEKSSDNIAWETYRTYTSKDDFNTSESGDVEEYTYLRVIVNAPNCTADLTVLPYTHEGIVKINSITAPKTAKVKVIKKLGSVLPTADWNFSSWSGIYGYPACSTFFQDRLVFAGSLKQPHTVWMSRSGDYPNFGVEKAAGQVTDDSAISISLISRELFEVQHLLPGQDLIILTAGNEWVISGSETVTPKSITPKVQTKRGSSATEPQHIGNRVVYVQRRGSTVRDMGYSFESDSYAGEDLTLLAKHLIKDQELLDSTYAQEPDSIIYFVRSDGAIICLTYLPEQQVAAWTPLLTDGGFESITAVPNENEDIVYVLVKRVINGREVRYIERFAQPSGSARAIDHIGIDCATRRKYGAPTAEIDGLAHLAGKDVLVVGDGYDLPGGRAYRVSQAGKILLDQPCFEIVAGLPYEMKIALPNVEMQLKDGTLQGRMVTMNTVIMRLRNSYGGSLGRTFEALDPIPFQKAKVFDEETKTQKLVLYSGDERAEVRKNMGYDYFSNLCILHKEPYPFTLNAVIREVAVGG